MSKNNHVTSDIKPQGNDEPSLGVILFFNVLFLITLWLILLVPLNDVFVTCWKKFSSCPSNKLQTLGVALILLAVAHLIWRSFGRQLLDLVEKAKAPVITAIGGLLLGIVRLIHPSVGDRALWAIFGVVFVIASVLVCLSPSKHGVPILLPDFAILRTTPPTEAVNPGDTLLVTPGEIVHITANVLGPTGFRCEWYTNVGTNLRTDGCSLTYSAPRSANLDNIAVLVSSPCRTDPEKLAGFHIRVAQITP